MKQETISSVTSWYKKQLKHVQFIEKFFEANKDKLYLKIKVNSGKVNKITEYKITNIRGIIQDEYELPYLGVSYNIGNSSNGDIIVERLDRFNDWKMIANGIEYIHGEQIIIKN